MTQPTDADRPRTASSDTLRAAAAQARIRFPWLPGDAYNSGLTPGGQYWDAVRVPLADGQRVAEALGDRNGAVFHDSALMYWLIPTGGANAWELPADWRVRICGRGTWVSVPGLLCAGIPRWRVLPTDAGDWLTSPGLLYRALADALRDGDA